MNIGSLKDGSWDWVDVDCEQVTAAGSLTPRIVLGLRLKPANGVAQAVLQMVQCELWWNEELIGSNLIFNKDVVQSGGYHQLPIATTPRHVQAITSQLGNQDQVPLQLRCRGVMVVSRIQHEGGQIVGGSNFAEPTVVSISDTYPLVLQIPRSDWYSNIVARLDASTIMFLEIAVPLGDVGADWQNVLLNFTKAQKAFALGDDPSVFNHLRGSFDALPGAKKSIFDSLPDGKREEVNKLTTALSAYLHSGRHVTAAGEQAGTFPVDHLDAGFALNLMQVLLSYISRALAAVRNS